MGRSHALPHHLQKDRVPWSSILIICQSCMRIFAQKWTRLWDKFLKLWSRKCGDNMIWERVVHPSVETEKTTTTLQKQNSDLLWELERTTDHAREEDVPVKWIRWIFPSRPAFHFPSFFLFISHVPVNNNWQLRLSVSLSPKRAIGRTKQRVCSDFIIICFVALWHLFFKKKMAKGGKLTEVTERNLLHSRTYSMLATSGHLSCFLSSFLV